jgi:hypothetical protein
LSSTEPFAPLETFKAEAEGSPPRCSGSLTHPRPSTPQAIQLHFQLDAQCSPIPGIPEEEVETSKSSRENSTAINTTSSVSSACTGQTARPMPDLNAFNGETCSSRDRSSDESLISCGKSHPSSPKLLCPPTPVRTPAWAHIDTDGNPLFKHGRHLQRSDSLIATKLLATCDPSLLNSNGTSYHLRPKDQASDLGASEEEGTLDVNSSTRNMYLGVGSLPRDINPSDCWLHHTTSNRSTTAQTSCEDDRHTKNETSISTNFDVISLLGSGAFADVYKVRSRTDGGLYALKRNRLQFRGKRDRDRALLEVRHMQRLQNASATMSATCGNNRENFTTYLLSFFQAWQQDGHFFCLTELCCRDTCRELIDAFRSQNNPFRRTNSSWDKLTNVLLIGVSNEPSSKRRERILPEGTILKICHDVSYSCESLKKHCLNFASDHASLFIFHRSPRDCITFILMGSSITTSSRQMFS